MNKYIVKLVVVLAFGIIGMTSCDSEPEGTIYNSTALDAAFFSTQLNTELAAQDNGVIEVPIYRAGKNGEASVKVQIDSKTIDQGLFSLTSPTVSFADGESSAVAKIGFDLSKLGVTDVYTIVLSLVDPTEASPSGVKTIKINAQRKLTWETFGTGLYTDGLFEDSWEQLIEKAKEGNIYRLPDCVVKGFPLIFILNDDGSLASFAPQKMGYVNATYGMVYYVLNSSKRQGNTLLFNFKPCVIYNNKLTQLYNNVDCSLQFPN
ncbi:MULTISPECIES: hypothetical protein [Bacteroides]|uniref:hypothetical protein n=1 Tax=Bacteroides TaxID=816 RepID=UPI0004BA5C45|nr:hypothetical protein [Bacteroides neonati]